MKRRLFPASLAGRTVLLVIAVIAVAKTYGVVGLQIGRAHV